MSTAAEKATALGVLEGEWQAVDAWLRSLDDQQLDRPVFGEGAGWRVRDLVTHLAWWQELAARVAEQMVADGGAPDDRGSRPYLGIETPMDELNTATYQTWRDRPTGDCFDRWAATHGRMMAAFQALSPDQLLQAEGGIEGLKRYFAVPGLIHLRLHREHIEAALKETATT